MKNTEQMAGKKKKGQNGYLAHQYWKHDEMSNAEQMSNFDDQISDLDKRPGNADESD